MQIPVITLYPRCISDSSEDSTLHDVVSSHWDPPSIFHWLQALICVWPAVLEAQQKKHSNSHVISNFGNINILWMKIVELVINV